ncbi:hypothetical protein FS842_008925 [Serendipita sp. 407]|nr:hypothetical protein FS842_008925 [Serendipita sp. 407]
MLLKKKRPLPTPHQQQPSSSSSTTLFSSSGSSHAPTASSSSSTRRPLSSGGSSIFSFQSNTRSLLRKSRLSTHSIYIPNNNAPTNTTTNNNANSNANASGSRSVNSSGGAIGGGGPVDGNQCVHCRLSPPRQGSLYCGLSCVAGARAKAPCLIELKASHPMFQTSACPPTPGKSNINQPLTLCVPIYLYARVYSPVAALFATSWSHGTPVPPLERIYAIVSPEYLTKRYNTYRDIVESTHQFLENSTQAVRAGNEQARWHGTTCACTLTAENPGANGGGRLCSIRGCSLCNIVRVSYDLSYSGVKWGRYGKGIYTTCTSSKASDYSKNTLDSPLKALLLNDVVIGKGIIMSTDSPKLTGPPVGYDSVLGVPGKRLRRGGAPRGLNYDETVVYRNDAIKPVYLVLYHASS